MEVQIKKITRIKFTDFSIIPVILVMLVFSQINALSIDTPFNFLRYQSNARTSGLSASTVALKNDPSALFINPALISTVEEKTLQVTFLKHVLDINSGGAAYIHHDKEYGSFAASIGFTSYGSFDYADKLGNRNGQTFGAGNFALGLSYSNKLDTGLYYGVTVKYIYAGIEDASSSALAFDAGLLYSLPDERTNLGFSVLHAGTQLSKISNQSESLPLDVRIGFNHRLRGLPLLFNFSFHHLADESDSFFSKFKNFNLGGELYLGNYIQIRLGYDNQVRSMTDAEANKGLTGFSGGVGITTDDFNFDYGLTSYGSSANLHRFSVSLNINKLL